MLNGMFVARLRTNSHFYSVCFGLHASTIDLVFDSRVSMYPLAAYLAATPTANRSYPDVLLIKEKGKQYVRIAFDVSYVAW